MEKEHKEVAKLLTKYEIEIIEIKGRLWQLNKIIKELKVILCAE